MIRFEVLRPDSVGELLDKLGALGPDAKLLAGGTDLAVLMKKGALSCKYVIDLKKVDGLNFICGENGFIELGALATHAAAAKSQVIQDCALVLGEVCKQVGSPQIRNVGTVVGNLANASPAADSAPALLVLGAELKIKSLRGDRVVALNEFFVAPGKTVLEPDELVESVRFKKLGAGEGAAFLKLGKRNAMAISVVNAAAYLQIDSSNLIKDARVALGAVAPTPIRAFKVEEFLRGKEASEAVFREAEGIVKGEVSPITDIRSTAEYRREVSGVLVRRALVAAAERALQPARGGQQT